MQKRSRLVEPLQVTIEPMAPGVAVRFLLDDAGLFGERCVGVGDARGEGEVRAGVEGRIDVDQVYLAGELGQKRWQHVLLVAPNEAVAPLAVAATGEEVERELALLGGFVDRLDRLE